MIESLTKIKSLLVASCDCCHQDNRDIALNMLEIALDEIQTLNPQDLEDGFQVTKVSDGDVVDHIFETACFNDELDDQEKEEVQTELENAAESEPEVATLDDDSASKAFKEMISKMLAPVNSKASL